MSRPGGRAGRASARARRLVPRDAARRAGCSPRAREILVDGARGGSSAAPGADERPIFRLEGSAGREAAEALRGAQLSVPGSTRPALEEGEYWAHELAGCAVVDGERRVGEVRRMLPLPSCEALEVVLEDGGELLVPMVRDAIRSVDIRGRRIDIDLAFLDR